MYPNQNRWPSVYGSVTRPFCDFVYGPGDEGAYNTTGLPHWLHPEPSRSSFKNFNAIGY